MRDQDTTQSMLTVASPKIFSIKKAIEDAIEDMSQLSEINLAQLRAKMAAITSQLSDQELLLLKEIMYLESPGNVREIINQYKTEGGC